GVVVALAQGVEGAVGIGSGSGLQGVGVVQGQGLGQQRIAQLAQDFPVVLGTAGGLGLGLDAAVDRPALLGDLGQVAHAAAGDQHRGARLLQRGVDVGLEVAARLAKSKTGVRVQFPVGLAGCVVGV